MTAKLTNKHVYKIKGYPPARRMRSIHCLKYHGALGLSSKDQDGLLNRHRRLSRLTRALPHNKQYTNGRSWSIKVFQKNLSNNQPSECISRLQSLLSTVMQDLTGNNRTKYAIPGVSLVSPTAKLPH